MDKFTINGRVIQAKEIDFNFICDLSNDGIELADLGKKILPAVRSYIAYCMDVDAATAGEEIQKHIVGGGNFEEVINVFNEKAEDSDFFRAMGQETDEKKNTKTQKKNTSKGEEA